VLDEPTLRRLYLDERRTIREIAATLAISPAAVNRALCRWDIPRRRRGPRVPVLDAATRAALPAHVAILGVQRTAKQFGIASRHIHTILGSKPLPRGTKPKIVLDETVWSAYEAQEGLPSLTVTERIATLAAQFGCSSRTVWRSLERTRNNTDES
jgi:hypothetical protein